MLQRWLAPTTLEEFVASQLGRVPLAGASTAMDAVALFDRAALGRVLGDEPAPDTLVVAQGQLLDRAAPRSLDALDALLAVGEGIVVRRGERHDDGLAALARSVARELDGEVHIQLFVTPGATHGFGWHHDAEEVFIVQTAGRKDYFFRANTVDAPSSDRLPDFTRVRLETSPKMHCTLVAGDWLYLPRGWWHMARCIQTSMSLSIGVAART